MRVQDCGLSLVAREVFAALLQPYGAFRRAEINPTESSLPETVVPVVEMTENKKDGERMAQLDSYCAFHGIKKIQESLLPHFPTLKT